VIDYVNKPIIPSFLVDRNEGFFDAINVLLQRFPKSSLICQIYTFFVNAYMLEYRRILIRGKGICKMENLCPICQKQFKDEEQVVLDIFSKVTHEACYDDDKGFITTSGSYKEIMDSYAELVDM
jgi:hypothetical protein